MKLTPPLYYWNAETLKRSDIFSSSTGIFLHSHKAQVTMPEGIYGDATYKS